MSIVSVLIFILVFSALVLVHEFGHFWAAVRAGVRVDEFGLGLPPRIWGLKRGKTIYSINWIPFGGFVKLKGEGADNREGTDSMRGKSMWQRFWVITGGVLMNLLFAYVLLIIGFWLGMAPLATPVSKFVDASKVQSTVVVMHVEAGSPADLAGLKAGDELIAVDGQKLRFSSELLPLVQNKKQVSVELKRGSQTQTLTVQPRVENNQSRIGVAINEIVGKVGYTWYKVPYYALVEFGRIVGATALSLYHLIVGFLGTGKVMEGVTGPVGIAQITAEAAQMGFVSLLQLVVLLSVNLGMINIVPFPALDGGRLLFLAIEAFSGGRKVKPAVENAIHSIGFILLLVLIFAVTYKDIVRLF